MELRLRQCKSGVSKTYNHGREPNRKLSRRDDAAQDAFPGSNDEDVDK